jgi:hypothetical protein
VLGGSGKVNARRRAANYFFRITHKILAGADAYKISGKRQAAAARAADPRLGARRPFFEQIT